MTASQPEPTVETQTLFEGKVVKLRVDKVRLPNGRLATREIVEHSQAVCIVPVDGQGNVLLVHQYRKPAEVELLEAPAGGMDDGETPEEAALRELQEEIGFTAGTLRLLSSTWVAPGWCTEFMHSYLATDLKPARMAPDDDENISVVPVPLDRIPELIDNGEILDLKSVASLLLALRLLGIGGKDPAVPGLR
jgi:ADP-ribose pyrophosphatase